MTVETSVYENNFTENEIEVYYIYDPDYKSINRNSVPANLQVPLIIETDFHWNNNDKESIEFNTFFVPVVIEGISFWAEVCLWSPAEGW